MKLLIFLSTVLICTNVYAFQEKQQISQNQKAINTFIAENPCSQKFPLASGTIIETKNGRHSIGNITYGKALDLFWEISQDSREIPFRYPEDGCYARAHEMAQYFQSQGVNSVKLFIEGDLRVETENAPRGYVDWWYHVVPAICVARGKKNILMAFDPAIFDEPVPAEKWFQVQTQHKRSRIDELYLATRFSYVPRDSDRDSKYEFTDYDNSRSLRTLKKYLAIQKERQSKSLESE